MAEAKGRTIIVSGVTLDYQELRGELQKVADEFLEALREEVDGCVLLCDVDRLGRLVSAVHDHLYAEVVRGIRAKGFDKELRELCDKVGRGEGGA